MSDYDEEADEPDPPLTGRILEVKHPTEWVPLPALEPKEKEHG